MSTGKWFLVSVKYVKQMKDGRLKRVTEPYLIDAVSFSEAEERAYKEVGETVRGEFLITAMKIENYQDIFEYDDYNDWYKCVIQYVSIDEDSGKEKKVKNNFLVTAGSVKDATERVQESLSDMTVTFEVLSTSLTPIVEVLPYTPDLDVELSRETVEEEA